jgi:hypothetical protein
MRKNLTVWSGLLLVGLVFLSACRLAKKDYQDRDRNELTSLCAWNII